MLKRRTIIASLIAATLSANMYAANLYLGPTLFVITNTSTTSNYRGLQPRMSLGYAQMIDDFYMAGEIFATPATATLTDNHPDGEVSVRSTRSFGVSLLPGGMITEHVLAFARIGVLSTQFPSPNSSRTAGQVGVGLQTSLTPYWDLRAEYDYIAYKTGTGIGSVKSDQVGVGLVYKVRG